MFRPFIAETRRRRRKRRRGKESSGALCDFQEACASLEEWERLMKRLGSGPAAPDTDGSPFTQVMGVITRMYKQTAVAKVMQGTRERPPSRF